MSTASSSRPEGVRIEPFRIVHSEEQRLLDLIQGTNRALEGLNSAHDEFEPKEPEFYYKGGPRFVARNQQDEVAANKNLKNQQVGGLGGGGPRPSSPLTSSPPDHARAPRTADNSSNKVLSTVAGETRGGRRPPRVSPAKPLPTTAARGSPAGSARSGPQTPVSAVSSTYGYAYGVGVPAATAILAPWKIRGVQASTPTPVRSTDGGPLRYPTLHFRVKTPGFSAPLQQVPGVGPRATVVDAFRYHPDSAMGGPVPLHRSYQGAPAGAPAGAFFTPLSGSPVSAQQPADGGGDRANNYDSRALVGRDGHWLLTTTAGRWWVVDAQVKTAEPSIDP